MRALPRIDLPLLAILAVAFALRVQGIADDGFWLDEITSLHDASKPVPALLRGAKQPGHPPLYYLLLKGWIALFGTSETAVRLLSAISGTAAVGIAFALFRALHGRLAGLAAALLLALSFHHIVFSQEARSYALFGSLALVSAHTLWRAISEGGRGRWALYVAGALLMAYTHHQAYIVLLGLAAGALLARPRKGALKGLALANAVVLAAATPSIVLYMLGIGDDGTVRGYHHWQPYASWEGVVDVGVLWTPGGPLFAPGARLYAPAAPEVPWRAYLPIALLLPAACLALAAARAKPDAPSPRPPPVLFHAGALHAGVLAFVVFAIAKPMWHSRYVFAFLPFFLGAIAAVLAVPRRTRARAVLLGMLVALSIPGIVEEKRRPGRTPWRETSAFLAGREGDAVFLVAKPFLARPLAWYYKRPFDVVPDAFALKGAVRRAAESGGRVLVVYCNAHGPPDPRHEGARELAQALALRGATRFGTLTVYEFEGTR